MIVGCRVCGFGRYDSEKYPFYHKGNSRRICRDCYKKEIGGPEQPFKYSKEEVPIKEVPIESRFEILDL